LVLQKSSKQRGKRKVKKSGSKGVIKVKSGGGKEEVELRHEGRKVIENKGRGTQAGGWANREVSQKRGKKERVGRSPRQGKSLGKNHTKVRREK